MAFVTLAELDQIQGVRRRPRSGWGLGQTPVPSCFLALPTNTAADEAQRRWLAMTEDQRTALRAPYIAQIKASAAVVTDDQARIQAEQRAVDAILAQVAQERANPRLCTDVIRSLFYSTLGSPLAESLFTADAVSRIKQSALANGVPADQIETLFAQAKAALGPLPQSTPQQAVTQSVDQVTTASGVSGAIPLSYTRERILAIRDEAVRRGVGYDQVTRLVRDEITKRIGIQDPNPYGDLEELAQRLGSPAVPAPAPRYAPPVPAYAQPPVYAPAPTYAPPSPVYTQPAPQPQEAPQPRSRRQQKPSRPTPVATQYPAWAVPAAAAAGGALLILLVLKASKN